METSIDSNPTVDSYDSWYENPSVEDEQPEKEDFRFLKIHPGLVSVLGFFAFLPMRLIIFTLLISGELLLLISFYW